MKSCVAMTSKLPIFTIYYMVRLNRRQTSRFLIRSAFLTKDSNFSIFELDK